MEAAQSVEPMSVRLWRLADELVDRCLAIIDSSERDQPACIHELRVATKRLRARWRMIRATVGDEAYQRADARLRDVSRRLSARRDVVVMHRTLKRLCRRAKRDGRKKGHKAIETIVERLNDRADEVVPAAVDGATWAAIRQDWLDERLDWQRICTPAVDAPSAATGLRDTYRRSRRLAKRAKASAEPAVYHEWRKRVKHLLYQLETVADACGEPPTDLIKCLSGLGDTLGKHNDLDVLAGTIKAEVDAFGGERAVRRGLRAIEKRAAVFARKSRRLGKPLFANSSKKFLASLVLPQERGAPASDDGSNNGQDKPQDEPTREAELTISR